MADEPRFIADCVAVIFVNDGWSSLDRCVLPERLLFAFAAGAIDDFYRTLLTCRSNKNAYYKQAEPLDRLLVYIHSTLYV